ncbi:MAG: hypothetical protein U0270_41665 [Labilithrix sp.]
MNAVQHAAGGPPRFDWIAMLEKYANRAGEVLLDSFGPVADRIENACKSVAHRVRRRPS